MNHAGCHKLVCCRVGTPGGVRLDYAGCCAKTTFSHILPNEMWQPHLDHEVEGPIPAPEVLVLLDHHERPGECVRHALRVVAVRVDPFKSTGLKPRERGRGREGDHFICFKGWVTRRACKLCATTGLVHSPTTCSHTHSSSLGPISIFRLSPTRAVASNVANTTANTGAAFML
jgi:hypothetical protein